MPGAALRDQVIGDGQRQARTGPDGKVGQNGTVPENPAPVQTGGTRMGQMHARHSLPAVFFFPWVWGRSAAGLRHHRDQQGADIGQGQKISFESANSIREMITASPPAIRIRNALSDGGWPVTASNA